MILNEGDAGRGPGGVHGFGVFGEGANGAAEAGDAVGDVGLDVGGIDQGRALKRFINGAADIGRGWGWGEADIVFDAAEPVERGDGAFCLFALVVPCDGAGEGGDAICHRHFNGGGNGGVPFEDGHGGEGDVVIGALGGKGEVDAEQVLDRFDVGDAGGGADGGALFPVAVDIAVEFGGGVFDGDGDVIGIDGGVPAEFFFDVLLDGGVGEHGVDGPECIREREVRRLR